MKKCKMFFDIEKEESWLNHQLQEGYCCTHINQVGLYTFEKDDEKSVMRLDYQDYLPKHKFTEYKEIYEDFGWRHIKGSRFGGIHYWQKEEGAHNEIFSDRQSLRNYYKRTMNYSASFGVLSLFLTYTLSQNVGIHGLYLTEGIWSMEGALFWKAFLFETPFALLRLLPIMMLALFAGSFFKAYRKYRMLKEK